MIATVAKHFTFDAAHFLDRLPPEHKCHRMHGHTYRVEIQVTGEVDENGFVVDYALIEEAWRTLMDQLDHRVLNDVVGLRNPTTENLAAWILARLGLLATHERHLRVRVYESATTWCEVYASALGELADPTEPAAVHRPRAGVRRV
jgi:6-pyruvoyltetrahydropterin/6-carboxytetrahydropterin synthase